MEFHEPDWCQVLGRVEKRLFHTVALGLFASWCAYGQRNHTCLAVVGIRETNNAWWPMGTFFDQVRYTS
jgi:hypothetical protein